MVPNSESYENVRLKVFNICNLCSVNHILGIFSFYVIQMKKIYQRRQFVNSQMKSLQMIIILIFVKDLVYFYG